jgi:hypothetical protein
MDCIPLPGFATNSNSPNRYINGVAGGEPTRTLRKKATALWEGFADRRFSRGQKH